jgi:hypothetical protein
MVPFPFKSGHLVGDSRATYNIAYHSKAEMAGWSPGHWARGRNDPSTHARYGTRYTGLSQPAVLGSLAKCMTEAGSQWSGLSGLIEGAAGSSLQETM